MGSKIFSFRLDEALIGRVDEICPKRGDRSKFVAAAIAEKLGSRGSVQISAEDAMEPNELLQDLSMEPTDRGYYEYQPKTKLSRPKKNFDRQPVENDGLRPDAKVLLSAIRKKSMTSRQAEKQMDWLGLRYRNAERELLDAGVVVISNGVLFVVGS